LLLLLWWWLQVLAWHRWLQSTAAAAAAVIVSNACPLPSIVHIPQLLQPGPIMWVNTLQNPVATPCCCCCCCVCTGCAQTSAWFQYAVHFAQKSLPSGALTWLACRMTVAGGSTEALRGSNVPFAMTPPK
jgi:hypothetical protein